MTTSALAAAQATWNPGLDTDARTLVEVYESMPKNPSSSIPGYVRLLENPRSPMALPGAIDLFGHDCVHAVLGRGLQARDEAFVLGFTMGSTGRCAGWQRALFIACARGLYRPPYRFSATDADVFDFAFAAAVAMAPVPLDVTDFRALLGHPLGQVRQALGISPDELRALYAEEGRRWPASSRSPARAEGPGNRGGGSLRKAGGS